MHLQNSLKNYYRCVLKRNVNSLFKPEQESPKNRHLEERTLKASKSHRTVIQLQKQDHNDMKPVNNNSKTRETAESSDESTIISSQTSTLTRSFGPEAMLAHADLAKAHLRQQVVVDPIFSTLFEEVIYIILIK
jgi:hypothetical protein